MSEAQPPNHRIDLTLTLGVNTPDDLITELHMIADRLDREGCDEPRNITSGFPGGSWHLEIKHDPTMTPERFIRELLDWAQTERAAKVRGAVPATVTQGEHVLSAAEGAEQGRRS